MSSSSTKVCFNSECRVLQSESWRRGWRLQIPGQYAELCDRCALFFEEGRFCETFHMKGSGWRCCESCGKRVHCGCIASIHAFILLDVGGVECIACARKNAILATNSTWPPPSVLLSAPNADRYRELPNKSWSYIAGAGPIPWRQAPSFFTSSLAQSESHSRETLDRDFSITIDRMKVGERIPLSSLEKRRIEDSSDRLMNGALKHASDMFENGNCAVKYEERNNCLSNAQRLSSLKVDTRTPQPGSIVSSVFPAGSNGITMVPGGYTRPILPSQSIGADPPSEMQIQSGRSHGHGRSKNHFFSRYLPRITEEELQKLSGDSNSKITPLFEKMLSASDAGKIGRLVLPKKCAEAYLPPISQPEGLPLRVQDLKGQEWVFQFRFWPNNNSRMYVLEGVTPCIQSMQLQAGDIVTFNRIEPEGKLVMGFRKAASGVSSDQGIQANKSATVAYTPMAAESVDPPATLSKVDKPSYISSEVIKSKPSVPRKRKTSTLVPKSKRLMVDNMDLLELKITWEEAQGLLRPPPGHLPSTMMVEGYEFEEYMDAPIIGKPTIFATGPAREKVQRVQCGKCSKWGRLPADAVIPSGWTCAQNLCDSERSGCSAAQELTAEQLNELLSACNVASSKKLKLEAEDSDVVKALEGLDTLADLAIMGESNTTPSVAQATTKHPRHKVGCSCIVCIQPPSGKGHKPRELCSCNVCLTVKSRFRTQMLRRERKQQSDKGNESAGEPQLQDNDSLLGDSQGEDSPSRKDALDHCDDSTKNRSPISPFKGQIDLNIQPEREDTSPRSDSGIMAKIHQDTTETHLKEKQALLSSNKTDEHIENQSQLDEGGEKGSLGPSVPGALKSEVVAGTNQQEVLVAHPIDVSMNTPASASTSR